MEKRLEVGDKTYVFEYTRASICKAEEVFGVSFLKAGEWETFEELNRFTEALMYAGLLKHNKDLKAEKMSEIHEISPVRTVTTRKASCKDSFRCSVTP
jgi:hypothetical protein